MVEKQVDELSEQVKELHSKVDNLSTSQAVLANSMKSVASSLEKLTDLRAETLQLMKQGEVNEKDHDEVFTRLREIDKTQAVCATKHVAHESRLKGLEGDRRWVSYTIIGAIILGVIALLLANPPHISLGKKEPQYNESTSKREMLQ